MVLDYFILYSCDVWEYYRTDLINPTDFYDYSDAFAFCTYNITEREILREFLYE